jgi:hypothetical protein
MKSLAIKGRSKGDACFGDRVFLFSGSEFIVLYDMGNQSFADDLMEVGVVLEAAVGMAISLDEFEEFSYSW